MNPSNLAVIFVGSIQLYMIRILYLVYLWLFFVPVFLVLTIVTALTVIAGCLLGGEKIFAYYPGNDLVPADMLSGTLSRKSKRSGKYRS